MRFCYLRMALLTSATVANAIADTTKTEVELATSRMASPPTFLRDDVAASVVTETHEQTNVDDEDRAEMTFVEFAKLMGKSKEGKIMGGLKSRHLNPFLSHKMNPKVVYEKLGPRGTTGNVLSDVQWIKWAYFVYTLGHHFEENVFEFTVAAMSVVYDAETLSKILITAANAEDTKALAINLAKFADDHIKTLIHDKLPSLYDELTHQERHTVEEIYQTRRGHIFAYLRKHVKNEMLQSKEFTTLISYLSILLYKDHAVSAAFSVSHLLSEDTALLGALLSLKNFYHQGFLDSLLKIWLDVNKPPSKIVSMLVQGKAKADQVTILFSNELSKSFWLRYLKVYNAISQDKDFTFNANLDFEQLLQMLFAVVDQELPATDKFMAYSTILKMLIAPSNAHLSSSHENVFNLMSILLWDRTLPSVVLSMLMRGEADANKFYIYFRNKSSKRFWVRYLKSYNDLSKDVEDFTRTANIDFQQLMIMLHDVNWQVLGKADKRLASSTILKILISPETTNVIADEMYLEEMTSNWLMQRVPPSDIVDMLVLEESKTDYFDILFMNEPSSKFWEDYTKAFYESTPYQPNHMFSTLTDRFGVAKLSRILKAAYKDQRTRKKAKLLYTQWRHGLGRTPKRY